MYRRSLSSRPLTQPITQFGRQTYASNTKERSVSLQEISWGVGRCRRLAFFGPKFSALDCRRRAEGFLGLWDGKRFQRFSGKRFKDVPNDEGDRKAVCNRVMHSEQNRCPMRLVKQYGSYEESVFQRERSRQFRRHFVFPPLQ